MHLIRHAKAKNRAQWSEPDELRPLTKRGRREAVALAERLADEGVDRLVSSPYMRCVQTLEPLALKIDLGIETTALLAEGAGGEAAVAQLVSLEGDGPVACCTHGDVVHEVVSALASAGVALDGPWEAPVASTWVLEVEAGRVVGARFVEPPPR